MKRIGVLSDTHGYVPEQVYTFFAACDELWHAGDIGNDVLEVLRAFKPVRAVWGNMDDYAMRRELEEQALFEVEGLRVLMTHIGGYPGHYKPWLRETLALARPDIFVCGHSHILKVMYDKEMGLLHINPGAAGMQGFHREGTLVRFVIDGEPKEMEIMTFPKMPTVGRSVPGPRL